MEELKGTEFLQNVIEKLSFEEEKKSSQFQNFFEKIETLNSFMDKLKGFFKPIQKELIDCLKSIPPVPDQEKLEEGYFDSNYSTIDYLKGLYKKINTQIGFQSRSAIKINGKYHLGWRFFWSDDPCCPDDMERNFALIKEKLPKYLSFLREEYIPRDWEDEYEEEDDNEVYIGIEGKYPFIIYTKLPIKEIIELFL